MKNLKSFSGNTHTFLDDVISSKKYSAKDPNYKPRVNALAPNVKVRYNTFDINHDANNHIALIPHGYINQDKDDLLKLYTSNNKHLLKLKNNVTTVLDNRAMNTCQYCTIDSVHSLDHIVPKNEFPEYAINPKNLLPACTICNSYKSENWRHNNKTLFLNLYLDILPSVQYVFVDIEVNANDISTTFKLENPHNIDAALFELLESHYKKLHLPERFSKKGDDIISELKNSIKASKQFLNRGQIIQIVQSKINDDKVYFGNNYHKSILEETLINNDDFMDQLFNE